MQIFYSVDNLNKRYWAWCVKPLLKGNIIYYYNNVTQLENYIACNTSTDAVTLYNMLFKGMSVPELISSLNNYGFNGIKLYIYLMQNGIIE